MVKRFLLAGLAGVVVGASVDAERVLVGHYATFGNLPVEQIPWSRLTHVCHAYLRLDADGKPVATDSVPNPALTADGRQNGVPVLLTVGGGVTVRGLEKATKTTEGRRTAARGILQAMVDGEYAGVELSWESPRNEETRAAHVDLLADLRRGLDQLAKQSEREEPYLLTASVPESSDLGRWVDATAIAPLVDWLTVLAYDMAGPWTRHAGHTAPLFAAADAPEDVRWSVSQAMRYWELDRGVPKNKLVVATPLFGRAMPVAKPFDPMNAGQAEGHRAMAFSAIRELAGEGWPAEWDNGSRAPWLRRPPRENEATAPLAKVDPDAPYDGPLVISYDDRNSVHMKATWAREQGYRGMSFWAIHQDRMPDGRHWLIDAAARAWPVEP